MFLTGLSDAQERRSQQLIIARIVQRYERSIAREIARAMNQAGRTIGQPMWEAEVRATHAAKMLKILNRLWVQSGKDGSARLFGLVKSMPAMEKKALTVETITQAIAGWVHTFAGEKITEITKTTMTDINTIVAAGATEGLSEKAIGKLIQAAAPNKGASRAQTIARTESVGAYNGISLDVAKESDIKMKKTWLTSAGERTRDAHRRADNQTVDMDGFFIVDGERLEYPGDPSGSAENVINCRCVVGYELS